MKNYLSCQAGHVNDRCLSHSIFCFQGFTESFCRHKCCLEKYIQTTNNTNEVFAFDYHKTFKHEYSFAIIFISKSLD